VPARRGRDWQSPQDLEPGVLDVLFIEDVAFTLHKEYMLDSAFTDRQSTLSANGE
jgi:hypothetical protein